MLSNGVDQLSDNINRIAVSIRILLVSFNVFNIIIKNKFDNVVGYVQKLIHIYSNAKLIIHKKLSACTISLLTFCYLAGKQKCLINLRFNALSTTSN